MADTPHPISDQLRPHVQKARQLASLALGHTGAGDEAVLQALKALAVRYVDGDKKSPQQHFYACLIAELSKLIETTQPVRLIGQIPLTRQSITVAVLTLDPAARLVLLLDTIAQFPAQEGWYAAGMDGRLYRQHLASALVALENIFTLQNVTSQADQDDQDGV